MRRQWIFVAAIPPDCAADINVTRLATLLLDTRSELQPSIAQHKSSSCTAILFRPLGAGKALPARQRVRYLDYMSGHSLGILPFSMRATE
jgi:malonyl CoA-acyl carrier protein transacylase